MLSFFTFPFGALPSLALQACLPWFMVENNTTYLEGREPSTSPGAKKRVGTCQSCKFISNNIKTIVAVEAPRVPGLMMALWLVLKQQKLGQESFISDLFTSKSLIAIIHWWCVIGEWQKDNLQTVMPALGRSKIWEKKSGWRLEKDRSQGCQCPAMTNVNPTTEL